MRLASVLVIAIGPIAAYAWWRSQSQPSPAAASPAMDPLPATSESPSFLSSFVDSVMAMARGERNNNPGNIRLSATNWLGQIVGSDKSFVTFDTAQSGIRAMAVLFKGYKARGYDTVRKIITRYAPATENNTTAYINAVSLALGVSPDQVLTLDAAQLQALVTAVIKHENGRVIYSSADIAAGVNLA